MASTIGYLTASFRAHSFLMEITFRVSVVAWHAKHMPLHMKVSITILEQCCDVHAVKFTEFGMMHRSSVERSFFCSLYCVYFYIIVLTKFALFGMKLRPTTQCRTAFG